MAYDYLLFGPLNQALLALQAAHNGICAVKDLPKTTDGGRVPKYIRIGKQPSTDVNVLITGGVHAREWAPPDALVSLAKLILEHYDPTPTAITIQAAGGAGYTVAAADVKKIVETIAVYIVPVVNPDGREYSLNAPGGIPAAGALPATAKWRKNRRTINAKKPAIGVDNNRNFDILWEYKKHYDPKVAKLDKEDERVNHTTPKMICSTDPIDDTYIGTGAASEAENQSVAILLGRLQPAFVFDIHSYGPDILYPWGIGQDQNDRQGMNFSNANWDTVRDGPDGVNYREYIDLTVMRQHICLGQMMHDAIQGATAANYPVKASIGLKGVYCTTGALDDYAFSLGKGLAYTIECGSAGEGDFHPTYTAAPKGGEFVKIEAEVHAGLLRALVEIANRGPDAGKAPSCPGLNVQSIPAPKTAEPAPAKPAGPVPPLQPPPPPAPGQTPVQAPHKRTDCCVEARGHCSKFLVRDQDGLREQLLFAGAPVTQNRVLAYETIHNEGPAAVRIYWDGPPGQGYQTAAQSTILLPGNSLTVAAGFAVKVVYEPGSGGDYAQGRDVISWCCPTGR